MTNKLNWTTHKAELPETKQPPVEEQTLTPVTIDDAFLQAANAHLADKTRGIYLEIVNTDEGDYYASYNHTELTKAVVNDQNMLVFLSEGMMPHNFGIKNILTKESAEYDCVEQGEIATNNYNVFGYKEYVAPNVLKPFNNDLCTFEVTYENGKYVGIGAANAHYYSYSTGNNMTREMRFKFIYEE